MILPYDLRKEMALMISVLERKDVHPEIAVRTDTAHRAGDYRASRRRPQYDLA